MTDRERLERLREAEAQLEAQAPDDNVARRLAALRHDIELALADIERTITSTRRAQEPRGEPVDDEPEEEPPQPR
jgi:hypothetical protein